MTKKNSLSRRDFFTTSAVVGAVGTMGVSAVFASCTAETPKLVPIQSLSGAYVPNLVDKAEDGKPLKAGVIGCGGRGSGAAQDFLNAGPNLQIVALGDLFQDRIDDCRKGLKEKFSVDVPDNMCFTGFDAYKKVLAAGVDIVIIATPPVFRPAHFEAAVEAGKHSFLEKPICVDPVGARSIMATAKKAEAQGLCVVTGTQRHHKRDYVESFKQIQSGLIGEIVSGNVYWNQSMLWYRERKPEWSDMEFMVRDWVNWKWLSGDHIVEQHVHNIDVFSWFFGKKPVKAVGFGAKQRRLSGDQYDMFSIDYEYEGGVHVHSMCRQIDGCTNNVSEHIQGTKGAWDSNKMEITDLQGTVLWSFDKEKEKTDFKQTNPYVLEHVDLVNHIRANTPINQAEETAISCLTGIMGRESAYSGAAVTWEEISNSTLTYLPAKLEIGAVDMSGYVVPVPGKTKEKKAEIKDDNKAAKKIS